MNFTNDLIQKAYIFESQVLNYLKEYLKNEEKTLITHGSTAEFHANYHFDGIIPEGLNELEGATGIEIKLYGNKMNYLRNAHLISSKINNSISNSDINSILLILGSTFCEEEKCKIVNKYASLIIYPFKIWDLNDLISVSEEFKDFNVESENLTEILVNTAISSSLNQKSEDWKSTRDERINQLKSVYRKDELVLFLGAGASKMAGISDWNSLISDLLVLMIKNRFKEKGISITDTETEYFAKELNSINENSPLLQAAFIKAGLGEAFEKEVTSILYKNFSDRNIGTSDLLKSISKLCLPRRNGVGIRAVVTYNFDDLLEVNLKNYDIKFHSLYSEMDYTAPDELGIYHVHGFLPRNADEYEQLSEGLLIFSEDGYHNLYNDPYSWANITQLNFLRETTTLMIGLSLTDPNLRRLLSISNRRKRIAKHFVILKRNNFSENSNNDGIRANILDSFNIVNNELQELFFEQLGLKIIWVESYNEIPELIESIKNG